MSEAVAMLSLFFFHFLSFINAYLLLGMQGSF